MSFDLIERSVDLAKPVRLYKFMRKHVTWAYNTSRVDVMYQAVRYKSLQISDGGIRQSGDAIADAFEIEAPRDLDVAQLFRGVAPSDQIDVIVYDMHHGDTEAVIGWMGSISDVKFNAADRCTIVCNTDAAKLSAAGLRFTWARGCQYVFGDDFCGVNKNIYAIETTVQSMDGLRITSGAFDTPVPGSLSGGSLEWPIGNGLYETRGITQHIGSTLLMMGGTDGLGLGVPIKAFPSCRRTVDACVAYGNYINYGGAPDAPGISPFDGNPIF